MSHIHGDTTDDIELEADERMENTVEGLQREMATIRTGRASIHLLDSLRVDYYGSPTPVNQMANLSTPEASLLVIQPWDVFANRCDREGDPNRAARAESTE